MNKGTETTTEATTETTTEATQSSEGTITYAGTLPDVEAAAAAVSPSVVSVTVYQQAMGRLVASSTGSGIIISEDGHVLTNYHVIEGGSSVTVTIGDEDIEAEVVGYDSATDLAVLKIDRDGLDPAEIGDPAELQVGEWVIAVGFPYGLDETVTLGIVSGLGRATVQLTLGDATSYTNLIQTDAAINPGNSGGALADLSGSVVGVNALIESETGENTGIGFAIPIDFAMDVADQLIEGGSAEHAYLGVEVSSSNQAIPTSMQESEGVTVQAVGDGSPAEEAGIQQGDVILRIGEFTLESASDLFTAVRSNRPGDEVEVELERDGKQTTVTVTLGGQEATTQTNSTTGNTALPPGHP